MVGMVIIGAGECGVAATSTLRERGYAGPVTLIGDEPYLPHERPQLSKAMTADQEPSPKTIATGDRLFAASTSPAASALRVGAGDARRWEF